MENRIIIEVSQPLSEADFSIGVGTVGWRTIYNPVFSNCEFKSSHLPGEPGIHVLRLSYKEDLFASIAFLSREPMQTAQVCFNFFAKDNKMYCTLSSPALEGLNRIIEFKPAEDDANQLSLDMDKLLRTSLKSK